MTRTQMVLETLVYSPFNHLMQMLAQEYFTEFSHCESFTFYPNKVDIKPQTGEMENHNQI